MKKKAAKERFDYVDVRFPKGSIEKVYTYRVRKGAKLYYGQSLVVENEYGTSVVFVVGINTGRHRDYPSVNYKQIKLKVVEL